MTTPPLTPDREAKLTELHRKQVAYWQDLKQEAQDTIDFWLEDGNDHEATLARHRFDRRIAQARTRIDQIMDILAGRAPDSPYL